MKRFLVTSVLFGFGMSSVGLAAEPRDSPVLVDFSENEQAIDQTKPPSEELAAKVLEALTGACKTDGAPTPSEQYKGSFTPHGPRQIIHYASCGTHPFRAKRVFAITGGGGVLNSGPSVGGKVVRLVEDIDGDEQAEVVLSTTMVSMGITNTRSWLVNYATGSEVVLQDFGQVFTSSDSSTDVEGCQERAAVVFLKVMDLSKMTRKDYRQPCGSDKAWAPVGDVPLFFE